MKTYLSDFNLRKEVLGESYFPNKVSIYDTTLRDGEQTIGAVFNLEDKLAIAKELEKAGVDRIEAGMPTVSEEDFNAVQVIVKEITKSEVWGFARCVRGDIDACVKAGVKYLTLEIPTSDYKFYAYGMEKSTILNRIEENVKYAKSQGLYVAFFAVDATRTELDFLIQAYETAVKRGGADEIVLVDTLGVATPDTMFYLVRKIKEKIDVPIMVHCHNDFGMATACTISAIKAGADSVQVTVNGLGEKTGNADIAEVVLGLNLMYGIDVDVDINALCDLAQVVEKRSNIPIPVMKPVVGPNVFKRASGVVVAQLMNYPPAVEGYSPEILGREREILLGKTSGKKSIEWALQKKGISCSDEDKEKILKEVKDLGISKKGYISAEEFDSILGKFLEI